LYPISGTKKFRGLGISFQLKAASLPSGSVKTADSGEAGLPKLYSTFPARGPGVGLLLLRAAIGATLVLHGAACFRQLEGVRLGAWSACLVAVMSGISLLLGFLTPIASVMAAVFAGACALSWLPMPISILFTSNPLAVVVIVAAMAIAFLGPGAFSLDSLLFGRRRVIIPRSSLSPRS
jgi:uncharacterized membrane protein YphA (DoxX/SURF4 family)